MSYTDILPSKAMTAIKKYGLASPGEKILVGFSGGPDSTALLHLLKTGFGFDVTAMHINHMLRGIAADSDENFCRDFCEKNGIPFVLKKIDVMAICRGTGIEEAARDARYSSFQEYASNNGIKKIALAHTASDNLETVLFNLVRGCGLSGMRGIPAKRSCGGAEIIRPLIRCSRDEILEYLRENDLSYVTDATNTDTHYTRNFIRHEIVPRLKKINPSAETGVGEFSERTSSDCDFIQSCVNDIIKTNNIVSEADTDMLKKLHPSLRFRVYMHMYGTFSEESLEGVHIDDIDNLLFCGSSGSRIILPKKIAAVLKNNKLVFIPDEEFSESSARPVFAYPLSEGENKYDKFCIVIDSGKNTDTAVLEKLKSEYPFFASAKIKSNLGNLIARNREPGDKYKYWGMTRTLKKVLSGSSDSAKIRPVICDDNGILWFPGYGVREDGKSGDIVIYYFEK